MNTILVTALISSVFGVLSSLITLKINANYAKKAKIFIQRYALYEKRLVEAQKSFYFWYNLRSLMYDENIEGRNKYFADAIEHYSSTCLFLPDSIRNEYLKVLYQMKDYPKYMKNINTDLTPIFENIMNYGSLVQNEFGHDGKLVIHDDAFSVRGIKS